MPAARQSVSIDFIFSYAGAGFLNEKSLSVKRTYVFFSSSFSAACSPSYSLSGSYGGLSSPSYSSPYFFSFGREFAQVITFERHINVFYSAKGLIFKVDMTNSAYLRSHVFKS